MEEIGVRTTAVPHAATSPNLPNSSIETGRFSTFRPRSTAICCSARLVIDGRIESECGVT